ncbi:MAG: agmatinase [bacterium]
MRLHPKQFLGLEPAYTSFDDAAVAILPFPYEGGISYGRGTAGAPDAVLEASYFLELYDEVLKAEVHRMGIATVAPPTIPGEPERMIQTIQSMVESLLDEGKFVVVIGGDHSISSGTCRALREKAGSVSVIQLDAHADLRDSYEGSRLSHACTMSRIREMTSDTFQLGIRSLSAEEAERVEREKIALCTMDAFRSGAFDVDCALKALPDPVFLTIDVDVFDWSVVASTGTPEPGGFLWDEAVSLLEKIFLRKCVIGFDVVELAYHPADRNSPFAVAKLIYKMLGFKLKSEVQRRNLPWPDSPKGNLFLI